MLWLRVTADPYNRMIVEMAVLTRPTSATNPAYKLQESFDPLKMDHRFV